MFLPAPTTLCQVWANHVFEVMCTLNTPVGNEELVAAMAEGSVRVGAPDDIDHIKYVVANGLAQLVVDGRVNTIHTVTGVALDRQTEVSAAYRTLYEPLTLLDRLAGVL